MTIMTRARAALVIAAAALAAAGVTAQLAPAKEPATGVAPPIAAPDGHERFLLGHAAGVQIYTCTATAGGHAWSFVAPRAIVSTPGRTRLDHYGGPTWRAEDGSYVVGRVVARSPAHGTIPWLLLEVASRGGPADGLLARTTYIQRIATTGGVAPTGGCDAASAGEIAEVPYTAVYVFWKEKS